MILVNPIFYLLKGAIFIGPAGDYIPRASRHPKPSKLSTAELHATISCGTPWSRGSMLMKPFYGELYGYDP